MPITSPSHSSTHSFNLWQPINLPNQVQQALALFEDRQGVDPQAILYWQPTHGEHANFWRHPDFAIYKTQVKELLGKLVDHCKLNGISEAKV